MVTNKSIAISNAFGVDKERINTVLFGSSGKKHYICIVNVKSVNGWKSY
jgi:hypothetical protein